VARARRPRAWAEFRLWRDRFWRSRPMREALRTLAERLERLSDPEVACTEGLAVLREIRAQRGLPNPGQPPSLR
jgi:hypothetical protein